MNPYTRKLSFYEKFFRLPCNSQFYLQALFGIPLSFLLLKSYFKNNKEYYGTLFEITPLGSTYIKYYREQRDHYEIMHLLLMVFVLIATIAGFLFKQPVTSAPVWLVLVGLSQILFAMIFQEYRMSASDDDEVFGNADRAPKVYVPILLASVPIMLWMWMVISILNTLH